MRLKILSKRLISDLKDRLSRPLTLKDWCWVSICGLVFLIEVLCVLCIYFYGIYYYTPEPGL